MKQNVDLVILLLEQGGSFSLISKHLRKKKVVMVAVVKNPNSFRNVGKNLKDEDYVFILVFQRNKELLRYASESLRKPVIQT